MQQKLTLFLILFVALEHIFFFIVESFLWETPFGMAMFKLTPEAAAITSKLALQQGFYNSFLAAGLLWSFKKILSNKKEAAPLALFFLSCVMVAGLVGGFTYSPRIYLVQAFPAFLGAMATMFFLYRSGLNPDASIQSG